MTWMGKLLSSFGIGAARVDTLLSQETYRPGETLDAKVQIVAGQVDQTIQGIHFAVFSQVGRQEQAEIAHCHLAEGIKLKANSTLELPVSLVLPKYMPITAEPIHSWLHTGLDIPNAIDPRDHDVINIVPGAEQQLILDTMHELGLEQQEVEIEPLPQQSRFDLPFLQRWHYRCGEEGPFPGLSQLTMAMVPLEQGFELVLESRDGLGRIEHHSLTMAKPDSEEIMAWMKTELTAT